MFVDANVFMYAVGRPHPLREVAIELLRTARVDQVTLFTSAEVLQELLHAYHPVGRTQVLNDAIALVERTVTEVWPLQPQDVNLARELRHDYPHLSARDLCHLASCLRRDVSEVMTFDQSLRSAFDSVFQTPNS